MIKFFRQIRHSMINQNRTKKYLLYAIGEIILVVIGILIALQINNWNEQRKILKSEKEILTNLKSELIINRDQLSTILNIHKNEYRIGLKLISMFNTDISNSTELELDSLIGKIESVYTFEANDGYIKSLIASGKIDHIQNKKIKGFITAFDGLVIDATQETGMLERLLNERFWPAVDGKINSSNRIRRYEDYTDFPKGSYTSDYNWFFSNRELEDIVSNMTGWKNAIILDEQILKESINHMIRLITNELNN
ncbi:DUF6090 family protein [Winogradskyella sp. MIT101101]|uniref:DUF6090 family protein n=1 Tax=Winogradskyella sp. MIT101101 TaxID=3098297 RepID=UPI0039995236